ncbi:MAG TPA: DUF503 domain-containing protein [Thermoanaerobaculia bacterium]|nr:DUF503 domain-containing protein [Thermoanaerobaculia bacterium]
MLVVVALFELQIACAQSLKDKRQVVRSVKDRLRNLDLSAKEVALQDLHQRARIAVSFIALDNAAADSMLEKIQSIVQSNGDSTMTGWTSEKLDFDETVPLT